MIGMVRMLRTMFDFVVVDMPPHFDDVVLALLEEADEVLLDREPRHPEHQEPEGRHPDPRPALGRRQQAPPRDEPGERPRAPRHQRRRARARRHAPSSASRPTSRSRKSVNRGVPVVLDKPRSPAALALRALADRYSTPDPGPADRRARGASRAAPSRLAPIANRRSHTMSQQYSRWQDLQQQPGSRRGRHSSKSCACACTSS